MDTTKTEALHFQLNLKQVLKWLAINRIVDVDVTRLSEQEIKAWFINHMEEVDFFGEVANKETKNGEITSYLFTLLHSFAHLVLRQCTMLSGFDVNTLSEYLFTKTMSFMIYVITVLLLLPAAYLPYLNRACKTFCIKSKKKEIIVFMTRYAKMKGVPVTRVCI